MRRLRSCRLGGSGRPLGIGSILPNRLLLLGKRRALHAASVALIATLGVFLPPDPARAELVGQLASDYQNGAVGQTSDDVGISANGGTWH
jgi:hypothetical protein